jgi:hypothetical protein
MFGQLTEKHEHQVIVRSAWLNIKHTFQVQGVAVNSTTRAKLGE